MVTDLSHTVPTGLLLSGGLDSAILLGWLLKQGQRVQPFYVTTGCTWEVAERDAVERFVDALGRQNMAPLVEFAMPSVDFYGQHWSMTGHEVPDETTTDEAVALPGRNPLLLLKPLLWCGQNGIPRLALGTLACNPFPDATPEFFSQFATALATATGNFVEITTPFVEKSKAELLSLAGDLPLHLTFSCLAPHNGAHCGRCNKCAERHRALQSLAGGDPTTYYYPMEPSALSTGDATVTPK